MRPTPLARTLLALAGTLYVASFFALTLAPAALASVLLVYLLHARLAAARAFRRASPRFTRRIVEPVLHEGSPFHVEVDPSQSALPEDVRLAWQDRPPSEVKAMGSPRGEGLAPVRYAARASAKGSRRFAEVRATLRDARGLWETTRRVPVATSVQILSSLDALEAGRVLARRAPLDASARSVVGLLVRDLEFESIRPFAPGDRLRDLDWKRVSLHGRLLAKTWEKEMEATVVLLLDAGRTMRARHGGVTKLDHAAALALELTEAAAERNHRVGYLAFDETGVVDELPPSRDRDVPRRLAQRLSELPGRIVVQRRLDVGVPGEAPVDEAETDFLAQLGALRGVRARPRPGVAAAAQRLLASAGERRLFLVAFTDMERVPKATLQSLARVAGAGHRVVAVVLPGTLFLAKPRLTRLRDLENAYREEEARRAGRVSLRGHGIQVLELGPEDTGAPIVRASHREGSRRRGTS